VPIDFAIRVNDLLGIILRNDRDGLFFALRAFEAEKAESLCCFAYSLLTHWSHWFYRQRSLRRFSDRLRRLLRHRGHRLFRHRLRRFFGNGFHWLLSDCLRRLLLDRLRRFFRSHGGPLFRDRFYRLVRGSLRRLLRDHLNHVVRALLIVARKI
jgi:hypothetical protein